MAKLRESKQEQRYVSPFVSITENARLYNDSPKKVFWYWVNERDKIRRVRKIGERKPWTKDPILQDYRFCNVFRIYDVVTQHYESWIKELYDEVVAGKQPPSTLIFNTCMYRLFNWPATLNALGVRRTWGNDARDECLDILNDIQDNGGKVFTGAYIITNAGSKLPKIELCCNVLHTAWKCCREIDQSIVRENSVQHAVRCLVTLPNFGRFLAYEVATDLTYNVLKNATDIMTWANAGPGAIRGLNRIHHRELRYRAAPAKTLVEMRELLEESKQKWSFGTPLMTMRDIENSLCEFDKYSRVLLGEGRPRARYNGRA